MVVLWMSILCYLLVGLIVFGGIVKGTNERADCMGLLALSAPFIIVGYPYFLSKRIFTKR